VDWRDRFRAGSIYAASRARGNPGRGVVISDHEGNEEAYAWDVASGALHRISTSGTAVLEAAIRPDGASIVYQHDTTGSEFGHLHEVPFEGGAAVDLTPELPEYAIEFLRVSGDVVTAIAASLDEQSLLCVQRGAEPARWPQEAVVMDAHVAPDGSIIAIGEAMDGLYGRTVVRSLVDGSEVGRLDMSVPMAIHDDRIAVALHRDGWLRPALWRPGRDPEPIRVDLDGDVQPAALSVDGRTLLLSQWHRAHGSLFLFDLETESLMPVDGGVGAPSPWATPELHAGSATATWSDAERPWHVVELGPGPRRTLLSVARQDAYPGATWRDVEFSSGDGTEVQGWLLTPPGDGPWPTILYAHGGPTSVMPSVFSAICQAWVDNGFALLSVNYRGSTTFGDAYREALTRHVGEVDVQDMVAGHAWLVSSGIADPDAVIVNGYSYGGYLALHCPALHPDMFAAGIAGAPVADWLLMGEDQTALLDAYDRALFGGDRADTAELHRRASPRTYVDRYRAPILITTPEADTRTPLRPIQAFVDDMRTAGKEVRLDLLRGGHAGVGPEQMIAMMESWLAFAGEVIARRPARIAGG
jgi:dipeptidyl aminopeptidase/acylaminoacyl peptidase